MAYLWGKINRIWTPPPHDEKKNFKRPFLSFVKLQYLTFNCSGSYRLLFQAYYVFFGNIIGSTGWLVKKKCINSERLLYTWNAIKSSSYPWYDSQVHGRNFSFCFFFLKKNVIFSPWTCYIFWTTIDPIQEIWKKTL